MFVGYMCADHFARSRRFDCVSRNKGDLGSSSSVPGGSRRSRCLKVG
jgi:hypothetical protein